MTKDDASFDLMMMHAAARLGWRGIAGVKTNPLVGCALVNPATHKILGTGWHDRFGGPHAEINALTNCRENNNNPRNATAFVTLEPCNHHGKTGPCTEALINAGIKRVVIARRDPNTIASGNNQDGGVERLRETGIQVDLLPCKKAIQLTNPFVKVITQGLPWIIIKWAQTIDGKIATRTGNSKWISNEHSRATVHRLRSRVDAVLTGIGTVISDDPMLTARNTRRIHKLARRIIIDPTLRIPDNTKLARSAGDFPTTIVCSDYAINNNETKIRQLTAQGVDILPYIRLNHESIHAGRLSMIQVMRMLQSRYDLMTVLVEAGPGLVESLMDESELVDELIIYLAPKLAGDSQAPAAINNHVLSKMNEAPHCHLNRVRRMGAGDLELNYHLHEADAASSS